MSDLHQHPSWKDGGSGRDSRRARKPGVGDAPRPPRLSWHLLFADRETKRAPGTGADNTPRQGNGVGLGGPGRRSRWVRVRSGIRTC